MAIAPLNTERNITSIVFIDGSLADLQVILSGFDPSVTAIVLDPLQNGIQQMADVLAGLSGLDAIHIISHGSSGQINLGTAQLSQNTLTQYQSQLATLGNALSATGDLLLYGCDVAQGSRGQDFISALANATGADVAASTDLTGAVLLGGNWTLEAATGAVEANTLKANIAGVLAESAPWNITQQSNAGVLTQGLLSSGSGITIVEGSAVYTGTDYAAGMVDALKQSVAGGFKVIDIPAGIVLTTGTLLDLPSSNTVSYYGSDNGAAGSEELLAYVQSALGADIATSTNNAAILEFSFTVSDLNAQNIKFDVAFASEEYPEFVGDFVDIAMVLVDGVNVALFNGDATKPLSVIQAIVDGGYFIDNAAVNSVSPFAIEYDGISTPLSVIAPLDKTKSVHTIKIGIADTNDAAYDSAVFVGNMAVTTSEGGNVYTPISDEVELAANKYNSLFSDTGLLDGNFTQADLAKLAKLGITQDQFNELLNILNQANTWTDSVGNSDKINLAGGDDVADGGAGSDTVDGGAGNDIISGGVGTNKLIGGAGIDTLNYSQFTGPVTVDLSKSTKQKTSANSTDILSGFENLDGSPYDDKLTGGKGSNVFEGGGGSDTIDGGAGTDTLVLDGTKADYSFSVSKGLKSPFEPFTFTGLKVTDVIEIATSKNNKIKTVGIEKIKFTGDNSTVDVTAKVKDPQALLHNVATYADDIFSGTDGNDTIATGQGNDTLDGGAGDDTLIGGAGNDTYSVDSISDVVTELAVKSSGTDAINLAVTYAADTYSLVTNVDNVEKLSASLLVAAIALTGNTSNNTITGGAGNDTLDGGAGADSLAGGLGNDTYVIDSSKDKITESSKSLTEIDTVQSSIKYTLGLNLENLTLTGSASIGTGNALGNSLVGNDGKNNLKGNAGNDSLNGGDGADTLDGGAGADTLDGGAGVDTLLGGAGDDTLIYDSADSKIDGGAGNDLLKLSGSGITLNLSQPIVGKISGIEMLDLTGAGNNNLLVNATKLVNLTGSAGHKLYVTGDAEDSVTIATLTGAMWTDNGVAADGYHQYIHLTGKVTDYLYVLETVAQTLV